jgi:uncharacterized protein YkwD
VKSTRYVLICIGAVLGLVIGYTIVHGSLVGSSATATTGINKATSGTQEGLQANTVKIASSSSSRQTSAPAKVSIDLSNTARLIDSKINQQRNENGLKSLVWDPLLAKIAAGHSNDMAINNYFSHNDLEGRRYTYRYAAAGYICQRSSGENIYWSGSSRPISEESLATKVVNGWMNSSGHRHNILNKSFQLEGVGIAFTSNNGFSNSFYITEDFCGRG